MCAGTAEEKERGYKMPKNTHRVIIKPESVPRDPGWRDVSNPNRYKPLTKKQQEMRSRRKK